MEKKKRMRTEKDKGYDKTYNSKTIAFSIGYRSENDAMEGQRLKAYLSQTGQSANSYIKGLIKADLDSKGFTVDN